MSKRASDSPKATLMTQKNQLPSDPSHKSLPHALALIPPGTPVPAQHPVLPPIPHTSKTLFGNSRSYFQAHVEFFYWPGGGALFRPIQGALIPTPDELLLLGGVLELSRGAGWEGVWGGEICIPATGCIKIRPRVRHLNVFGDGVMTRTQTDQDVKSGGIRDLRVSNPGSQFPVLFRALGGWGAVQREWVERDRAGCVGQASLLGKTSHSKQNKTTLLFSGPMKCLEAASRDSGSSTLSSASAPPLLLKIKITRIFLVAALS